MWECRMWTCNICEIRLFQYKVSCSCYDHGTIWETGSMVQRLFDVRVVLPEQVLGACLRLFTWSLSLAGSVTRQKELIWLYDIIWLWAQTLGQWWGTFFSSLTSSWYTAHIWRYTNVTIDNMHYKDCSEIHEHNIGFVKNLGFAGPPIAGRTFAVLQAMGFGSFLHWWSSDIVDILSLREETDCTHLVDILIVLILQYLLMSRQSDWFNFLLCHLMSSYLQDTSDACSAIKPCHKAACAAVSILAPKKQINRMF